MKKYACKNVRTEDLWSVLSDESGVEVNKLMDLWTKQTGYPVIHVKSEDNTLEFEQVYPFKLTKTQIDIKIVNLSTKLPNNIVFHFADSIYIVGTAR